MRNWLRQSLRKRRVIPPLSFHHIVIRLPGHLVKKSAAVPDYHLPPSPGQVGCEHGGGLDVFQACPSLSGELQKARREDDGILPEVFRRVVGLCPDSEHPDCLFSHMLMVQKVMGLSRKVLEVTPGFRSGMTDLSVSLLWIRFSPPGACSAAAGKAQWPAC